MQSLNAVCSHYPHLKQRKTIVLPVPLHLLQLSEGEGKKNKKLGNFWTNVQVGWVNVNSSWRQMGALSVALCLTLWKTAASAGRKLALPLSVVYVNYCRACVPYCKSCSNQTWCLSLMIYLNSIKRHYVYVFLKIRIINTHTRAPLLAQPNKLWCRISLNDVRLKVFSITSHYVMYLTW